MAKFRHYLIGNKFVIKTDQQELKHLNTQVIQTLEQQKWLPKLLRFDFSIKYKPSVDNLTTDGLSRCFLLAFSMTQCSFLRLI